VDLVDARLEVADRGTAERELVVEDETVRAAAADELSVAARDQRVVAGTAVDGADAGAGFPMEDVVAIVAEYGTRVLGDENGVVTRHAVHHAGVIDAALVDDVVELITCRAGPGHAHGVLHHQVVQAGAERPIRIQRIHRIHAAGIRLDDIVRTDEVAVVTEAAIERVGLPSLAALAAALTVERVVAGSADHGVQSKPAGDRVVVATALQNVVRAAAGNLSGISSRAGSYGKVFDRTKAEVAPRVIAAAVHRSRFQVDRYGREDMHGQAIDAGTAVQDLRAIVRTAAYRSVTDRDEIVARTTADGVGAVNEGNHVVSIAAVVKAAAEARQGVITATTEYGVDATTPEESVVPAEADDRVVTK
jgi:hypothetical protein